MRSYSAFGRYASTQYFHELADKSPTRGELAIQGLDYKKLVKRAERTLPNPDYSDFVVEGRRMLIFNGEPHVSLILSPVSEGIVPQKKSMVSEKRGIGWAVRVKSEDLKNAKQLAKELSELIHEGIVEQADSLLNAAEDALDRKMEHVLDRSS